MKSPSKTAYVLEASALYLFLSSMIATVFVTPLAVLFYSLGNSALLEEYYTCMRIAFSFGIFSFAYLAISSILAVYLKRQ